MLRGGLWHGQLSGMDRISVAFMLVGGPSLWDAADFRSLCIGL